MFRIAAALPLAGKIVKNVRPIRRKRRVLS